MPKDPAQGTESSGDITRLLRAVSEGEESALETLASSVYSELERVASSQMRRGFGGALPGLTLEPAALVNDTLMKVLDQPMDFENRRHFYSYASKVMLRTMIDYQRRRSAAKRGGDQLRVTLTGLPVHQAPAEPTALAEALNKLEKLDERKAEVVRLKTFWGLTNPEVAETMGVSTATVDRDWTYAKNWLCLELSED